MEAGYDYLLLRGGFRQQLAKYAGIGLIALGVMLLASGGAYYGYAAVARADLEDLNATAPGPAGPAPGLVAAIGEPGGTVQEPADRARLVPPVSPSDIGYEPLYSGEDWDFRDWSNPWDFESIDFGNAMFQGFTPVDFGALALDDVLPSATRLVVPGTGIDSTVEELQILDLGGSRAYETPANTIGHLAGTANAGERGSSWFFGHTQSPIAGEGSVFSDLTKIPEMMNNGENVFIIAENGDHQFLYRVTSSDVVHQEDFSQGDLHQYETGLASIHLVSCVPSWVYDHRLIVTGELIAQRDNI